MTRLVRRLPLLPGQMVHSQVLGQSDQLVLIQPRLLAFERARMAMDLYLHLLALDLMDMELHPDLGLEMDLLQVLMVADQLQLLKPDQQEKKQLLKLVLLALDLELEGVPLASLPLLMPL